MNLQPLNGIQIKAKDWPRGISMVDVANRLRQHGYQLVMQRCTLLAIRVH